MFLCFPKIVYLQRVNMSWITASEGYPTEHLFHSEVPNMEEYIPSWYVMELYLIPPEATASMSNFPPVSVPSCHPVVKGQLRLSRASSVTTEADVTMRGHHIWPDIVTRLGGSQYLSCLSFYTNSNNYSKCELRTHQFIMYTNSYRPIMEVNLIQTFPLYSQYMFPFT